MIVNEGASIQIHSPSNFSPTEPKLYVLVFLVASIFIFPAWSSMKRAGVLKGGEQLPL